MAERSKYMDSPDLLKTVYGRHAAKKIARRFSVGISTAKLWLSGGIPVARRRELAEALIAEIDQQIEERLAMRAGLVEGLGDYGVGFALCSLAGAPAGGNRT